MTVTIQLPSNEQVTTDGSTILIGTDISCDVCLPRESGCQAQHALIRKLANRWLVESLGDWSIRAGASEQGKRCWLQPGDLIHLMPHGPVLVFEPRANSSETACPLPCLSRDHIPRSRESVGEDAPTPLDFGSRWRDRMSVRWAIEKLMAAARLATQHSQRAKVLGVRLPGVYREFGRRVLPEIRLKGIAAEALEFGDWAFDGNTLSARMMYLGSERERLRRHIGDGIQCIAYTYDGINLGELPVDCPDLELGETGQIDIHLTNRVEKQRSQVGSLVIELSSKFLSKRQKPFKSRFHKGDLVIVKSGVKDEEFPELDLACCTGKVLAVDREVYFVRWDDHTLDAFEAKYGALKCEEYKLDADVWLAGDKLLARQVDDHAIPQPAESQPAEPRQRTCWYYSKEGEQAGPISSVELKKLALSGKLQPTDLVRKDGMAQWSVATKVKGLFSSSSSTETPAPLQEPRPVTAPSPAAAFTLSTEQPTLTSETTRSSNCSSEQAEDVEVVIATTTDIGREFCIGSSASTALIIVGVICLSCAGLLMFFTSAWFRWLVALGAITAAIGFLSRCTKCKRWFSGTIFNSSDACKNCGVKWIVAGDTQPDGATTAWSLLSGARKGSVVGVGGFMVMISLCCGGMGESEAYKQGYQEGRNSLSELRNIDFAQGNIGVDYSETADLDEARALTGRNMTPYEYDTSAYWDFVEGYKDGLSSR